MSFMKQQNEIQETAKKPHLRKLSLLLNGDVYKHAHMHMDVHTHSLTEKA